MRWSVLLLVGAIACLWTLIELRNSDSSHSVLGRLPASSILREQREQADRRESPGTPLQDIEIDPSGDCVLVDGVPDPFARIKKKYGIYVVVRKKPLIQKWAAGAITADPADPADAKTYTPLLVEEFCIYPVGFVKRTKLRQIILVKNLRFGKLFRALVPDFTRNVLYIDVSRGRKTEHYARRMIHHEYYHVVDYLDDGLLFEDPGWAKLNPASFRYGRGGAAMRDTDASLLSTKFPGFLNKYSTSAIEEDKAEVFSYMVMSYAVVEERAKKDKVLKKKMAYMKKLSRKFSRDLSPAFWSQRCKGGTGFIHQIRRVMTRGSRILGERLDGEGMTFYKVRGLALPDGVTARLEKEDGKQWGSLLMWLPIRDGRAKREYDAWAQKARAALPKWKKWEAEPLGIVAARTGFRDPADRRLYLLVTHWRFTTGREELTMTAEVFFEVPR